MEQIYIDRINQIIDDIKNDPGDHFRMADVTCYVKNIPDELAGSYVHCSTAFCIGGWANFHRLEQERPEILNNPLFRSVASALEPARKWLGLDDEQADALFMIHTEDGEAVTDLNTFDDQPIDKRRKAAVQVLETLRDDGIVDWRTALVDAGLKGILDY